MLLDILKATGIPFKESRFNKAPSTTYAVYTDSITRRGADNKNLLSDHRVYIELYSKVIDKDSEKKLESELDARSITFDKSERVWFEDEQKYQLIYNFEYTEKGV